jgi:phage anti-repressor protein
VLIIYIRNRCFLKNKITILFCIFTLFHRCDIMEILKVVKMNNLVKIEKNGVSAYSIYTYLQVVSNFSTWFKRRVNDYKFKEGIDFVPYLEESTGGRPREDYIVSVDMAKELAIVEKTDKGREVRHYLINIEKKYREQIERDSSKVTRRGFTDLIRDTGENERMHGFAYPTYTKMIYKKLGITFTKEKNFRDSLDSETLKAIETLEHLAEGYLRLGYDYNSIKEAIPEIILSKDKMKLEAVNS